MFALVANGEITEAYDRVEQLLNSSGWLLQPEVVAELRAAKDALFRARVLTDGSES